MAVVAAAPRELTGKKAAGEGASLQLISDTDRDFGRAFEVGNGVARFLLSAE